MEWKGLVRSAIDMARAHSPAILTGLGIAGFATTIIMTAKAAPDVKYIHDEAVWNRGEGAMTKEELKESYMEEAKVLAPLCAPPAIVGILSVACFIGSNKVQSDRHAAVLAAYSLSAETLARYQDKVIERLGEEEHRHILKETTNELANANVPKDFDANFEVIPAGQVRVFDAVTGRYFYSTKEKIYEAESTVNQMLVDQTIILHEEFYYLLDLEEPYGLGRSMGWDISSSYGGRALKVWLSPHLDNEKNPCLAMNYHVIIFDRSV